MRIYVAAKFEEAKRVQEIYKKLIAMGHIITHDWTHEDPSGLIGDALEGYMQRCAENDFSGAQSADAVLVLNHDRLYGGATEMGMAIAPCIPVYVVGDEIRSNVFFHLRYDMYKFSNVDDAIEAMTSG